MANNPTPCVECGMPCYPAQYHPYAACLMFKACHDSGKVSDNLAYVVECGKREADAQHERIVAGLEADARRYRYVRANPAMLLHLSNREFDAAIDAFLAQTSEGVES